MDPNVRALLKLELNSIRYDLTKKYKPKNGLPQGSLIAPKLFNIYLNGMIQDWYKTVGREPLIVAYADDLAIVNITKKEWESFEEVSKKWELKINKKKTKIMDGGKEWEDIGIGKVNKF